MKQPSKISANEFARQWLKNNDIQRFANNGGWKRGAAKYLHDTYPDIFPTWEKARASIRCITLSHGNRQREGTRHKEFLTFDLEFKEDLSWQTAFRIPSGITEMAVMGDFHGMYMNKGAIEEALSVFQGVKTLLINGDLLDNTQLSRWAKQKDSPILSNEFTAVRALIEELRKHFDVIYFKEGNHDHWLKRKLMEKADQFPHEVSNEILEKVSIESFLHLTEYNVQRIHNLQEIKFGDLSILHGHERAGATSAVNLGQNILTWWQRYEKRHDVKILVNHHHYKDQFSKTFFDDKTGFSWCNGCLCDIRPTYSPYGRHNHGVALATHSKGIANVMLFEV